jgi:hypothetical protein
MEAFWRLSNGSNQGLLMTNFGINMKIPEIEVKAAINLKSVQSLPRMSAKLPT